jgi:hypothetical protein
VSGAGLDRDENPVASAAADEHDPSGDPDLRESDRPTRRPQLRNFVELFALCGFAIAQPLLDIFGRSASQFLFRGAEPVDLVLFGLVITFVPALVLWAVESAVGVLEPRLRQPIHLLLVAALVAAFVVQLGRNALGDVFGGVLLWVLAVAVGAGAVELRRRSTAVRLWLSYAAIAPLVFLGMFLFGSESSRVIRAEAPAAVAAGIENPHPVVMVVLDELPLSALVRSDGTIDDELYPRIAELADGAHWFRNTTTVSTSTGRAVPSIVTGRYPAAGTAPVAADHPDSLFTLLGGAYGMNVTESVTRLCPSTICTDGGGIRRQQRALLGDAIDVALSRLSWSGEQGDPVAGLVEAPAVPVDDTALTEDGGGFADFDLDQSGRFRTLIEQLEGGATLNYLHILLPHVPYRYLPTGEQYPGPDPDLGRDGDDWIEEPWLTTMARQRLQLQLGYVDSLVGELLDQLSDAGIYDDALVMLASDHGISFRPGGPIRALEGQPLEDGDVADLIRVPLLVKLPGQREPVVDDRNVETIDLLPTIADVLGIDLPWEVDGRSVFAEPRPDDVTTVYGSLLNPFGVEPTGPYMFPGALDWPSIAENATDRVLPAVGRPGRLYLIGPRDELVGSSVEELGDVDELDLALDEAGAFTDVDTGSGGVPALIRGALSGGNASAVAVSVNGVVAATAPTYQDGNVTRLAVMVPPESFRDGANEVRVHRIG